MSYSISASGPRTDVLATLDAEADTAIESALPELREAVRDHLAVGKDVARQVLATVGSDDRDVLHVGVYGHANENHAHSDSWAPECLTVAVQVTSHYVEPPAPPEDDGVASDGEGADAG